MDKPKFYKVNEVLRWVDAAHFETRYIIKENKDLDRWDIITIELPKVSSIPTFTNPYEISEKGLKELRSSLSSDEVKIAEWAARRNINLASAIADLSEPLKQYFTRIYNTKKLKDNTDIKGAEYYSYYSTKYYHCYVKDNEVFIDSMYVPSVTYATREKAIEALTKRITDKALKGGAFKQAKARTRAENTLKWLLELEENKQDEQSP